MGIYGSNYDYGESPLYKDEGYIPLSGEYFTFLPNWLYNVSVKYMFKTIVSTNRTGAEQRKSLAHNLLRELSLTITEYTEGAKIWNHLISKRTQKAYIPLYTEPMRVSGSGSLIGQTTINYTNDSTHYYNLRNFTDNIALLNFSDPEYAELIGLNSVGVNSVTLSDAVTVALNAESTVMYPAIECYLDKLERNEITDSVTEINCTFMEALNIDE